MENKSNKQKPYKRPLRIKQLYHDLFNVYYNSHKTLTFQKLSNGYKPKEGEYFMKSYLKVADTNDTNNSNFINELESVIDCGVRAIGFVVTLLGEETGHLIGGIIFPSEKRLELYDPSAVARYPLKSTNPWSLNNLYDYTLIFFDKILNEKYNYFAHIERAFIPGTCEIHENGICALWSIIYVIMRMSNVSVDSTHRRIFEISNSSKSKLFMIKLMKNIQKLTLNKSPNGVQSILNLIQFENV